jgi:tetratricopeptide (TPR) repeat protein
MAADAPPPSSPLPYRLAFGAALALLGGSLVTGLVQRARQGIAGDISFDPLREAGELLNAGRPADAAERFRMATRLERSRDAERGLAQALGRSGDAEGALAAYGRVARMAPRDSRAANDYGAALLDAGRTADAEPWLRRALALDPQFVDAYNNLGIALARTGRLEAAIELLEKARSFTPTPDPEVEGNLARLRAALGARTPAARP